MNEWWLISGLLFLFIIALIIVLYPLRKPVINRMALTPIIFCFVAFAYWRWGALHDWKTYIHEEARQKQIHALLKKVRSPDVLVEKLKERLIKKPESMKGWYLLGKLYASQGQWQQARDAFATAYKLKPNDEQNAVNYAQSLWQLNNQQFNAQIRTILHTVLQKNPEQPDTLAMLAMDAFMGHSYQSAIDYWQQLLKIAPAQSEDADAIRKAIAQAQLKLTETAGV